MCTFYTEKYLCMQYVGYLCIHACTYILPCKAAQLMLAIKWHNGKGLELRLQ